MSLALCESHKPINRADMGDSFLQRMMVILRPRMPLLLKADRESPTETPADTKSTGKAAQKVSGSKRKQMEREITAYEQERLDRIARNRKVMAKLGVKEAWMDFQESVMGAKKAPKVKRQKAARPAREANSELRKSARLDPAQRPVYQDSKAFEALMSSDRSIFDFSGAICS